MAPFYLLAVSLAKLLRKGTPGGVPVAGEGGIECQRQLRNPELNAQNSVALGCHTWRV